MIRAVLRVVLDHEDGHLLPELAVGGRGDDATEREVIAADAGLRRILLRRGAEGVVLTEGHDGELRKISGCLGLLQIGNPVLHLVDVTITGPFAAVRAGHALGPFAIVFKADAATTAEIPEVAGSGGFHLIVAGQLVPAGGIRQRPGALIEVSRDGRVAPAVPVHADLAVAEEIV